VHEVIVNWCNCTNLVFYHRFEVMDFSFAISKLIETYNLEDKLFLIAGTVSLITLMFSFIILNYFNTSYNHKGEDVSRGLRKADDGLKNEISNLDKVLSPVSFKKFKLVNVKTISSNTKLLRFEIPHNQCINLPIGRHISVRAEIDGNKVTRAYTPTSRPDMKGYFDLLVKAYEFGKMSTYLHSLRTGDEIEVRGPIGSFKYGSNMYPRVGLIAGGTGLTPCLQVLRCVLEGPEAALDRTAFTLLFQNRTFADILLREELDDLRARFPDRVQLHYFLSNPSDTPVDWAHGAGHEHEHAGYITQECVTELLCPAVCPLVCVCGPSGFNDTMKRLLQSAGHDLPPEGKSVYVW